LFIFWLSRFFGLPILMITEFDWAWKGYILGDIENRSINVTLEA